MAAIGTIITFYSYKGGVGRSMALANVAILLARLGHKILIIDWDLEAPGLDRYFQDRLIRLSRNPHEVPGIMELLTRFGTPQEMSWRDCLVEIVVPDATLHMISSGRRDAEYASRLQKIDWQQLFDEKSIGELLELIKKETCRDFNFVLIDIRAGVTDIGDVCTAILADVLVLMFVTNDQNIKGVEWALQRAQSARQRIPTNRGRLMAIPVLGRDEIYNEHDKALGWKTTHAGMVQKLAEDWLPEGITGLDILQKLFVPYVANWSFGERLPVVESLEDIKHPASISASYARLASLISSGFAWEVVDSGVHDLERQQDKAKIAELELRHESRKSETRTRFRRRAALVSVVAITLWSMGATLWFYQRSRFAEDALVRAEEMRVAAEVAEADAEQQLNQEVASANEERTRLEGQLSQITKELSRIQGEIAAQSEDLDRRLSQVRGAAQSLAEGLAKVSEGVDGVLDSVQHTGIDADPATHAAPELAQIKDEIMRLLEEANKLQGAVDLGKP